MSGLVQRSEHRLAGQCGFLGTLTAIVSRNRSSGRSKMRRREFIAGLGSAAAWPIAARGQQRPGMPVVGVLTNGTESVARGFLAVFLQGLREQGFVEGRPGGNVTGVTGLQTEVLSKRLGLLHELVPGAATIGFLTGPRLPPPDNIVLTGARTLGLDVIVGRISSARDFEPTFSIFAERSVRALVVDNDVLLDDPKPITSLAERYKIPAMYPVSLFVQHGGLISYSSDVAASYRQAAAQYVGPILKGAKPADLPVQQPNKFELVINMKTAKALGLTVPRTLLVLADEVIE